MRAFFVLLCLFWPVGTWALEWATKEVCEVSDPQLRAEAFWPYSLIELKAESAQVPNGVGKYWRIEAPGGAVSHLWGTIHSNDPMMLDLPVPVEQAIRDARIVMPEYDFAYPSRPAITSAYRWEGAYLTGAPNEIRADTLDIDPQIWAWIIDRLDYRGWGRQAAAIYSVDTIVSLALEDPCNDFASGILPIQDARIQMLAEIAGAEVRGLEPRDALKVFLNRPGSEEVSRAILTIYGTSLAPQVDNRYREASFALYLSGQNALWNVWHRRGTLDYFGEEKGTAMLEASMGYLIDTRNEIFVASSLGELQQGGAFLAVGVGHISGPRGMVELLRSEGFTVTRIRVAGEAP